MGDNMKAIIIPIALLFLCSTLFIAVMAEREGDKFVIGIEELTAQAIQLQQDVQARDNCLIKGY